MKSLLILLLLITFNVSRAQQNELKLKDGFWVSKLYLNDYDVLPFYMKVTGNNSVRVINDTEEIVLERINNIADSFVFRFPNFNSQLVFSVVNDEEVSGYWQNFNRGDNYKIVFKSFYGKNENRFSDLNREDGMFSAGGKWEVHFEPNTEFEYPAIGVFKDLGDNHVTGTFMTETGDYRFLEGNTYGDSLFLSCFDGTHAFLFKAAYVNDSLKGNFYSGNHWSCEWEGVKNDNFEIRNPEELTYLKPNQNVSFELENLDREVYRFPNNQLKDKVVIIQIMGSWCPNCLDETIYYKDLYKKYHDLGLEIISIGYETGKGVEDYIVNLKRLKDKLDLNFEFLIGGSASKSKASEDFNMLNAIISFPTSIFIGKDGVVKRIHTGFNGPGTGEHYLNYTKRTEALIELLISQ